MWNWLHVLLTTKTRFTDYTFLTQTLAATLNDPQLLAQVVSKYFSSGSAAENAMRKLGVL